MTRTATEVEVKKTTTTNNRTIRNANPLLTPEEQNWYNQTWLWIATPLALAALGSTTFFLVRNLLHNRD